jgi:hypothetical protein
MNNLLNKKFLFILIFTVAVYGQNQKEREHNLILNLKTNLINQNIDTYFTFRIIDHLTNNIEETSGKINVYQEYRTYIFWKCKDEYYVKKIDDKNEFKEVKIKKQNLYDFAFLNLKKIEDEVIKPHSEKINGEIIEIGTSDNFYAEFTFNNSIKSFNKTINLFDIEYSKELPNCNYDYNKKLKTTELYNLCLKATSKFEKEKIFRN